MPGLDESRAAVAILRLGGDADRVRPVVRRGVGVAELKDVDRVSRLEGREETCQRAGILDTRFHGGDFGLDLRAGRLAHGGGDRRGGGALLFLRGWHREADHGEKENQSARASRRHWDAA
jgi:hypothetical protein